jgi:hypothetical protein
MQRICLKFALIGAMLFLGATPGAAYTANQVAFEFRPNGIYRVYLYYTVPALKEFRESVVEFTSRKKAEKFYFEVLRGADFYIDDKAATQFVNEPLAPSPW